MGGQKRTTLTRFIIDLFLYTRRLVSRVVLAHRTSLFVSDRSDRAKSSRCARARSETPARACRRRPDRFFTAGLQTTEYSWRRTTVRRLQCIFSLRPRAPATVVVNNVILITTIVAVATRRRPRERARFVSAYCCARGVSSIDYRPTIARARVCVFAPSAIYIYYDCYFIFFPYVFSSFTRAVVFARARFAMYK